MFRVLALWVVVLGVALSGGTAAAQDKPPADVEERDLGDGFRAVSVNGGPWAIIDDRTGLIMKQIAGQPAIVDRKSGAIMVMGDDGKPMLKFYKGKGGGGGKRDPRMLARMKAFLERAQKYGKGLEKGAGKKESGKQGAGKKVWTWKKRDPAKAREALVARLLKLLGVSGEEATVIRPMLAAVLLEQDRIRRSTTTLAKARRAALEDLPNDIRTYLQLFRAVLEAGNEADEERLSKALPAYRAARKKQRAELAALRKKLRELLTVGQEAKLAAVGVLE